MNGLKGRIEVDRKVLADMAVNDPPASTQHRRAGQAQARLIPADRRPPRNRGAGTPASGLIRKSGPFCFRTSNDSRHRRSEQGGISPPTPPSAGERQGALPRQERAAHRALKALAPLPSERQEGARRGAINVAKQRSRRRCRRAASARATPSSRRSFAEALDVTLPGRQRRQAACTRSRTMERIEAIFGSMGFDVADGPRSRPTGNFTALNTRRTIRRARCRTPSTST